MRPHCIAEERLIGTLLQSIDTTILLIGVANGEIGNGSYFIVDNGLVPYRWPQHMIPSLQQRIEQLLELLRFQDRLLCAACPYCCHTAPVSFRLCGRCSN